MFPSLPPELCGYFRSYFITALADAGTDGRVQIFRAGTETSSHGPHRFRRDLRRGASPAGVYRSHRTAAFVNQQNRNAIGGLHGDYAARLILDQRIAFSQQSGAPSGGDARRGVDLFQRGKLPKSSGNIGKPRSEAMYQPRKCVQIGYAVNVVGVPVEHGYTGFCVCAMRICDLNFSNMDSSNRTSVGRLTSVVIWSILSCNFISA